jgi:tetratricopeptide (TPR) repeat protein
MTKIKIGRNDPCHCGSGQKYKRCCQDKDEAAERAARAAAEAAKPPTPARQRHTMDSFRADIDDDLEELTDASNAVIDMVHAGKLDEAEAAARELIVRFPEVHDGYDRLGMVYEARGDKKQAADYYRQVIDFVQSRPDQYQPGFETPFQKLIQKLDPPAVD